MCKETRRHVSLETMLGAGFDFEDETADIEYIEEKRKKEEREITLLQREDRRLEKERKRLETKLTPRQAEAYFKFRYLKMKKVQIAQEMGVTEGAVRKLILKAEENLEKVRQKEREERQEEQKHRRALKKKQRKGRTKAEEMSLELKLLKALFGEK